MLINKSIMILSLIYVWKSNILLMRFYLSLLISFTPSYWGNNQCDAVKPLQWLLAVVSLWELHTDKALSSYLWWLVLHNMLISVSENMACHSPFRGWSVVHGYFMGSKTKLTGTCQSACSNNYGSIAPVQGCSSGLYIRSNSFQNIKTTLLELQVPLTSICMLMIHLIRIQFLPSPGNRSSVVLTTFHQLSLPSKQSAKINFAIIYHTAISFVTSDPLILYQSK